MRTNLVRVRARARAHRIFSNFEIIAIRARIARDNFENPSGVFSDPWIFLHADFCFWRYDLTWCFAREREIPSFAVSKPNGIDFSFTQSRANAGLNRAWADFNRVDSNHWLKRRADWPERVYIPVDSDVSRRANYLVNEIKLERIKGRAVVRMQWREVLGEGFRGNGRVDNRGKGDGAGIRLANAFISIRRGRVTCSPLRSISSTSFARSPPRLPPAILLPSLPLSPFVFISSPTRSLSRFHSLSLCILFLHGPFLCAILFSFRWSLFVFTTTCGAREYFLAFARWV